jgi:hypothetical protein
MRKRDLIAAAVGGLTVTVLAGSVAWAAIPGDGGVIQGCYDTGGNVKVVATLPCPKGYTALAWAQQGPAGDQGEKGDPGNLALAGRSCPPGSFLTGFDARGELVCGAPEDGGGGGGEPGELLVSPLELVFASTPVGALSDALIVTFTNTSPFDVAVPTALTGENASDFVLDGCQVAPAAQTCQLQVQFSPTGLGLRTATILVQLPDGGLVAVELSGTGA